MDVTWTDQDENTLTTEVRISEDGDPDKPLVLLLHGNGGNIDHLANPAASPAQNYDFNAPFPPDRVIGWRDYPGIGVWSFNLDDDKAVEGWEPFLNRYGFTTLNYTQIDPTGFLERPVRELAAIVDTVLKMKRFEKRKLVFLTHSRGGLLARKFLKDHAQDAALQTLVDKVITLHSPHLGSQLANVASSLAAAVASLRQTFGAIIDFALGWLNDIVNQDSYIEMRAGGPFLADLSNGEQAFPGAAYHTFGGTSPLLTRIRSWVYTASSAIPQWHLPPFRHKITLIEVPIASPVLNSLPNIAPEITEAVGDMLVADSRAHLSWAQQRTNSLNHAEALWDPGLKDEVLRILREEPAIWS
jgi:pimeloyl-ACP methyl ester carboxylesterase